MRRTTSTIALALVLSAPWGARAGEPTAFERGCQAFAAAQYERAAAEFREVEMATGPEFARARYNLGVCYFELGRLEMAIEAYRDAIRARRGDYPKALYALGVALEERGRAGEASAAYRLALQRSGGRYADAHFRLGLLAYGEGMVERAERHFLRAVDQAEDGFPAARHNLEVCRALATGVRRDDVARVRAED